MLPHLIPKRLRFIVPSAVAPNSVRIWKLGEGPFVFAVIHDKLVLRPDLDASPRHGVIEPATTMNFSEYQDALASTRPLWTVDES
jgi:hypothetical protein